jgi:hypothetical protein
MTEDSNGVDSMPFLDEQDALYSSQGSNVPMFCQSEREPKMWQNRVMAS